MSNNAGKYSAKHPSGAMPDPVITSALQEVANDGKVACVLAHDLAEDLGVAPAEVGRTIDLLEYRITKCQLGLFGYLPEKKVLRPADLVPNELRERLTQAAREGDVPCATCWEIAQELGLQRMAVAAAGERLGLKVKPCQLGAF